MKTSELHTLKSILTEGIRIEGQDDPIKISCIYIPKIQRAYAQGRKQESDVRNDFLDDLFDVLIPEEDKYIELSFLFGSQQVMAKRDGIGFELLDGQQRTTTLFLLYWYIRMKEYGCVPDFLSNFTYETRDTSAQFLEKITASDSKISIKDTIPSDAIKKNKWFTDEFYCDPTVCAMLNMLDAIDQQYSKRNCNGIYDRLERLQFYVLMLEKFDMNDELYIKMNSRGLSLVPFENFKASVVKFMKAKERNGIYGTDKVVDGQSPYWLDFTAKVDAKWIDLFWKYDNSSTDECNEIIEIDDKKIGIRYFNFINRYLFTKSGLADNLNKGKLGALSSFFLKDAESERMKQRLFGWKNYEELLSSQDYFHKLEKVLDELHRNWDAIKAEIQTDPYKNVESFDLSDDEIKLHPRVIFAAITEFIEGIPEGKSITSEEIKTNFKRMLRVVFNIIENTTIESPEVATRVIKAVSEIIAASGAITGNFYKSLATTKFNSRNQQLQEEIAKAKEMFSNPEQEFDPSWENAFIEAEKHPFFKGSILFFFTAGAGNSNDFRNRYNVIKDLFDAKGITQKYRKEHILIRAIISQINYWSQGLEDRYITEDSEREKFLKILLTSYPNVRAMFCNYFDQSQSGTIEYYLNNMITNAAPKTGESKEFNLLFHRLVNDQNSAALFDWISQQENKRKGDKDEKKKHFRLQNANSYLICIPGKWYDKMILDTERHLIIPELVNKYSMVYEDNNQKNMMEGPVKDTWGRSIRISMDINGISEKYKLLLQFNEYKKVEYLVYSSNTDLVAQKFNVSPENKSKDYVMVRERSYQFKANINEIEDIIDHITNILKAL